MLQLPQNFCGISQSIAPGACVEATGISRAHAAALRFHGDLDLHSVGSSPSCTWLIVGSDAQELPDKARWDLVTTVGRANDPRDQFHLYRRKRR